MNVDEPSATLRTLPMRLYDNTGADMPLAHVFVAGDVKVIQPDGTVANAAALPVPITGASAGSFQFTLARTEIQQPGYIRIQVASSTTQFYEWIENIGPLFALNEALATKRTIAARFTGLGVGVPASHVFLASEVKVIQPGGTVASSVNLPTFVTGAANGSWNLVLAQSEIATVGQVRVQIASPGMDFWEDAELIASTIGKIVWSDVSALAPEMSTTNVTTQGDILNHVNIALNVTPFGGDLGVTTRLARIYYAAHLAALAKLGTGGALLSESIGGMSRSYAAPMTRSRLSATSYGLAFLQLLPAVVRGPQVT